MDEHRDLVIAQLAVVRRATEVLAAHGVAASAPIEAAIQIVERWAIEGGVDGDDLAAAARAAWDDGAPLRLAHEPALRARMWLGTAAGNLGQMARAERGWKGTPRTILDAAASALASLDVPGLPRRPELAQLAADALAAVAPASGRRPTPGPPPPIPLGPTPELGELASAYLAPALTDQLEFPRFVSLVLSKKFDYPNIQDALDAGAHWSPMDKSYMVGNKPVTIAPAKPNENTVDKTYERYDPKAGKWRMDVTPPGWDG